MNPYPDHDSPDVTDQEAELAHVAWTADQLVKMVTIHSCQTCGKTEKELLSQELRRKKPRWFNRVISRCPEGHVDTYLLEVPFIEAGN